MTWEALALDTVSYAASRLESARFHRTIARLSVGWGAEEAAAAESVARTMQSAHESLLIVRWPTHMFAVAAAVASSKRSVLVTDILTYWEGSPDAMVASDRSGLQQLRLVLASTHRGEADAVVADVVRDSFNAYGNHYRANPDLDQDAALAGYVEWAQSSLRREAADVLFLVDGAQVIGLATLSISADGHDLEIELAGVLTSHQGRGLYAHLLLGCAEEARRRSCRRLLISTQVHNSRVQRSWARSGMVPYAAFTTAHASRQEPGTRTG